MKKIYLLLFTILFTASTFAQTIASQEVEPNGTVATASPIVGTSAKIKGNISPDAELDYYSFTAAAGDKLYAAIQTSFTSNASFDAQLRLFASDGTTLIEFDEDDGSLGSTSSSIAGATIPAAGTYYLQVKHFSATNRLHGYDLYFRLQNGTPTPEVESNDVPATANTMPTNGWVSGARNPAVGTEQDWFSVTLAAGETVFISMDLDPERDNVQYNGRLGFALFGDATNQILVIDDASTGSVANPLSEAFFYTAKNAGTYYVFADATLATTGGPTATYNISFTKFAATSGYINYPSTNVPQTIPAATGSITSTITIADSKLIKDIGVRIDLTHTLMADIDATLTSPNGSVIHLFTDIGATATGGQQIMNLQLNDNNGVTPVFTVMNGVAIQPEVLTKLDMLKGVNTAGTWTLTLYDDLNNASGGTLNNWSLDVLEEVPPNIATATVIANENFETGDGGFTHAGVGDEWSRGTPSFAPITTANSGVNCWKTDLANTYNASCDQTLSSPTYALPNTVSPKWLSWAMKHQVENRSFDSLRVYVEEVGNPTNYKTLFNWLGATPTATIGSPGVLNNFSAGWGTHWADVTSFAGKNIQFKVKLASDNSVQLAGVAIDDFKLYDLCSPSSITLGTSPTVCSGITTANLPYTATTGTPDRYNIDYDAAAEAQGFVDVVNAVLPATPITLTVPGGAIAATYNGSITVQLAAGGCLSPAVAFTVTINPTNTVTLTSAPGTNAQTVCINAAITNITYSTTDATGATFSGLPAGVTGAWAANVVTISGTPTVAGPFSYTVTLTGGCGSVTANGTITVEADNTITLSSAPATTSQTVCISTPITNITYSTTGATGATFSGLPAGVTGAWASNVVTISGSPTTTVGSPFSYTVTLTGGCGTITASGTITVSAANTIALTSAPGTNIQSTCLNSPITNITYSTTGATGATFSSLPAGVTGAWAGNVVTISGAPTTTVGSPFTYTVTLTGGCGTLTATGTITVRPLPVIASTQVEPTTCASADGSITLTLSGAAGPYTFAWTGSGVNPTSQNQTGLTVGAYSVTVTAANGCTANANIGLSGPGGCGICPTIPTFTTTPSGAACSGSNVTLTASGLTNMGSTYGIIFKYSTTALADPYVGGTTIATIANGALTSGGTVATANTTTIPVGNYFVYAILTPTPVDPACRPAPQVNLTIGATPDVNTVANQVVCNGVSTTAVNFTSSLPGTVFNWTISDPSIGLAASGSGNIGTFTATNTGTTPVVATITVTPSLTSSGGGGGPVTQNFIFTGTLQTFTVPAGVTSLTINASGAQGGTNALGVQGGQGGAVSGSLNVTPGQVLNVYVGGTNGYNGGGIGGTSPCITAAAGNGGGATDIRIGGTALTDRVLVAAGGGGAGGNRVAGCGRGNGGGGGGGYYGGGGGAAWPSASVVVPIGGSQVSGGIGGTSTFAGAAPANNGVAGVLGIGGDGGLELSSNQAGTNVGALGASGGGANGDDGAYAGNFTGQSGAGGSSYIGSLTSATNTSGVNTGNGSLTITYTSAASVTCTGTPITYTYTVNPTPTAVATPASQTVCSGNAITTIALTGAVSGTTYNWTRDNTGTVTGIAASGSGDITGTLTNTTTAPVTVTFTITPTANGCPGTAITATVLVNPTPTAVATPAAQTICSANPITTIVLTGAVSGTTYAWTRDNTATVTGIAASGSGDISGTLTNTTFAPVTVTFTITPTANGCPGAPITATVLVNPTPNAFANPASQTVCSGLPITTIVLTGNVAGTTFNWTRNNTATVTGIAASGSGDIAGTLTNTTFAPITVTFTITPTANGCPGTPITATVLVNPTPNAIATPASQTICSGTAITPIALTGNVAGTTYAWTRDNTVAVTGIAASGTGNSIAGTLTNTTPLPVTVTFTITPTANGCTGPSITATVLVNPRPVMTALPATQTICNGVTITPIVFASTTPGTTYTWTRDNSGATTAPGGIQASGSGPSITGFMINTTFAPITVTFTITPTFAGCVGTPVTATVTIQPTPTAVATPATQVSCSGSPITTINLTGLVAGTVFTWTRDNVVAATGIAASGTGNISGTLTTTSSTPVAVTFIITPSINGCNGPSIIASDTVYPTPSVNQPGNQVVCNGGATTAVTFTGTVTGTAFNWTNNTPSIGLAATGTGNIPVFTAVNTTNAPVTATITVTPVVTSTGCVGVARTFTITVNPTATVATVPNQTLCTGSSTAAINFTSTVAGTTFSWTNNTPSIGLAASGTGNIPSFIAINTTPTAVTATITVTPNTVAGCVGVATTFTITVNGNSVAPTGATSSVVANCGPTSATLTVVGGALGTGASWRWYSGSCGGTLVGTGASITIPVNTTTTYFVRAEGTCNTTGCSPGVTVTINTIPTISIAAAPFTALTPLLRTNLTATVNPTAVGNVVEWFKDNGPLPIATGLSITNIGVDQVGSYRARITTAQGCTATSNMVEIRDSATGQLFVYPNPNNGKFQIRYYLPENSISVVRKVAIFDSKGALVYNQRISVQTRWGSMDINIQGAAQGSYFIKILDVNDQPIIGARVQVLR